MASADPLPEPIAEPALPTIKPRPPHPGFWWSLLWCLAFDALLFGTLISVVVLTLILTALASGDPREYMSRVTAGKLTEGDQAMLAAPGYLVGEVVSVLFAWLIIRAVVGRGWKRELAVRLPSAGHLALALLALPALLTLPDLVHQLARQVLPSFRDSGEDAKVIAQWPLWFGVLIIGVLPGVGEELWCRGFLGRGLVDLGRQLHPDDDALFTWWAPWRNLRQRNIGWRIDYVLASQPLAVRASSCEVQAAVGTSDHAPVVAVFS